jgi:6-pyruvoyltetrahydropterin/6-carboxytetrahydropterin synthase
MQPTRNPSHFSGENLIRVEITRRFYFSAGHRYYLPDLSEEENRRLFGECVHPHGHNYVLDVTLTGPLDPKTGMIINLSEVKAIVHKILTRYDHRFLNDDHPTFKIRLPTTEMIALTLAEEISAVIPPPCQLKRVRVYETDDLFAEVEFSPEGSPGA